MPGLQEYVIRLSADVDNTGVSKIMSLLDMNKMKALGLTAALTAATTAVYKFIESATKKEIELDNLAKKQKKSIEDTRAQKEALDQMGMSLNDIKKDAALKSIYDDLVKFNKEMEMPNASGAIAKVRLLQGAFWKLKSAVSYVVQRVGLQMLENLEQPMDRFTSKLNKISDWIRDNFTSITTKISKAMTGFSKGIITIVEGVEKVLEFINKIPDGVKGVAAAIAALFAIIKSGPIGWLLAAVTAIGDIVHDFENYQYNKENGFKKGDEGYVENLNDLIGIWDAVDDANKSGLEKVSTVGTLILQAFADGLKNIPAEELGTEVGNFVNDIFTKITEAMTGTGDGNNMISALTDVAKTVVTGIMGFISAAFQTIDLNTVKDAVGSIIDKVFNLLTDGLSSASDLIDTITANADPEAGTGFILAFVESIVSSISKGFDKLTSTDVMGDVNNIIQKVFGLLTSGIQAALKLVAGGENKQTGEFEKGLVQYGADLIKGIFGFISEGLKGLTEGGTLTEAANLVQDIFGAITGAISNTLQTIIGGKNEKTGEYEKGLVQYGADFARNILQFITEGAKTLETKSEDIAAEIGSFISTIFAKIGDFLANSGGDFANLLGDGFTAVATVAQKILDVFLSGIKSLAEPDEEGKSGIQRFVKGIFDFISDTIQNLSDKVDAGELKLDETFGDIGSTIGEIIGGAIEIGLDFLGTFIKNAGTFIAEHTDELMNLGRTIAKAIIDGFASMFSAMFMRLVLGEEGYDYYKSNNKNPAKITEGEDGTTTIEQGGLTEQKTFSSEKEKQEYIDSVTEKGILQTAREESKKQVSSVAGGSKVRVVSYDPSTNEYLQGLNNVETNFFGQEGLWSGYYQGGLAGTDAWYAIRNAVDTFLFEKEYERGETLTEEETAVSKALDAISEAAQQGKEASPENMKTVIDYAKSHEDELGQVIHVVSTNLTEAGDAAAAFGDAANEATSDLTDNPAEETPKEPETNPADFVPEDYSENTGKTTLEEAKVSGKTETKGLPEPIGYVASAGMSDVGGMGRGKGLEGTSEAGEGVTQLGKQSDNAAGSVGDMATDASNAGSTLERFDKEVDLAASKAETLGDKVKGASLDLQESSEHFKTVGTSLESVTGSATSAKGAMDSLASGASHAAGVLSSLSAGGSTPGAMGGRFDRATEKRIGEAGTEYLIPITKHAQAIWLATQMLREMGKEAFQRISSALGYGSEEREESRSFGSAVHDFASGLSRKAGKDFSLGTAGTIGGSLGGIENALQNMQQNFTYNISAPVSIQVQSSGASAEEIGTKAYDLAERHLLKTLRGAYA